MRAPGAWLLLAAMLSLPVGAQETAAPQQQITDLDQLLQSVREEQRAQRERNRQREQQFLRDKKKQQSLLQQARRDAALLVANEQQLAVAPRAMIVALGARAAAAVA